MFSRRSFTKAGLSATAATLTAHFNTATAATPVGTFEIMKSADEWKKLLTKEQFYVLRDHGTERAGSSPLDKVYTAGMYHCAACDLALYSSERKFDSGTGWPSFWKAEDKAVGTTVDKSFFMTRTEVHCSRCGGHQGHIFPDGPKPTGERHCINGVALKFVPKAST
jgi:peptide-methionine (R)-S-oxide reductase